MNHFTNDIGYHEPLVSVVVVTYNSARTVIDTLNSIKNQSYQILELVVSDDGSTDNTIKLCNEWIYNNKQRFVSASLLTTDKNTGTVKNLNRGVKASKGTWIKGLAADDALVHSAISDYVSFVQSNKEINICSARLLLMPENKNTNLEPIRLSYEKYFNAVSSDYSTQKRLIYGNAYVFPGPGWFFSRELYNEVGGFDEKYILMEEWPFANAVLNHGYRIFPLDKELVIYRVSSNSVSHQTINSELGNRTFFNDYRHYFYRTKLWQQLFHFRFDFLLRDLIYYECRNSQYKNGVGCWQGKVLNFLLRHLGRSNSSTKQSRGDLNK